MIRSIYKQNMTFQNTNKTNCHFVLSYRLTQVSKTVFIWEI